MGIQGMHQAIKPYMQPVHISKFAGRRVGCDGYAWLHRGAVSCAQELHIKPEGSRWWDIKGDLPPYVSFCMRMVRMMRAMKVTPVVSDHRTL